MLSNLSLSNMDNKALASFTTSLKDDWQVECMVPPRILKPQELEQLEPLDQYKYHNDHKNYHKAKHELNSRYANRAARTDRDLYEKYWNSADKHEAACRKHEAACLKIKKAHNLCLNKLR